MSATSGTIASVHAPPTTTALTAPIAAAMAPARKAPISYGQPQLAREAERDDSSAPQRNGDQHDEARPRPGRQSRQHERRQHGAHRRRRPEQAQPRRPRVENVFGKDRQKRDGATKEHGEEVERDRAEKYGRALDEADTAKYIGEAGTGWAGRGSGARQGAE
jgi:hypothetical protein